MEVSAATTIDSELLEFGTRKLRLVDVSSDHRNDQSLRARECNVMACYLRIQHPFPGPGVQIEHNHDASHSLVHWLSKSYSTTRQFQASRPVGRCVEGPSRRTVSACSGWDVLAAVSVSSSTSFSSTSANIIFVPSTGNVKPSAVSTPLPRLLWTSRAYTSRMPMMNRGARVYMGTSSKMNNGIICHPLSGSLPKAANALMSENQNMAKKYRMLCLTKKFMYRLNCHWFIALCIWSNSRTERKITRKNIAVPSVIWKMVATFVQVDDIGLTPQTEKSSI
ncbi:hypothetical protein HD554DRAFT_2103411 [Boletus coccyginus]|nr:hypothetical protein HD554DRAFT_2103411 [Boletus coccyginus]